MCLSPITIINPSRYISLDYPQPYKLDVPCGHCCECQQQHRSEWYLRTYYEVLDTLKNGGYMLFDTLTYSDRYLPFVSKRLGHQVAHDYPCFDYDHVTRFLKRLRKRYSEFSGKLRYFIVSEYGTDPNKHHRPHYHVLFFVRDSVIDPCDLSKSICREWSYGRTDGYYYRGSSYVLHECVFRDLDSSTLRAASYVAKYVGKSNSFLKQIQIRIDNVYNELTNGQPASFHKTSEGKLLKRKLMRMCNQFHRQSIGFGLSALYYIGRSKITHDGYMTVPSTRSVKSVIAVPMYFKRKLFYDLVNVDGSNRWFLNALGVVYNRSRRLESVRLLSNTLAPYLNNHLEVADYCINHRGRLKSDSAIDVSTYDLLDSNLVFNYVTQRDYDHFRSRFVSDQYSGNYSEGYNSNSIDSRLSLDSFIDSYIQSDSRLDADIDRYKQAVASVNSGKQRSEDLKEVLRNKYKMIGIL